MHVFVYERNMMNSFKYSKLFFIISKQKSALYVFFLPKQGTLSCVLYNLEASAIVMICALWAVIVMIVLLLDLQLPMQSVHILTKVVSSNTAHGEVYSLQHYVIKFVSDLWQVVVFSGYSGFLHQ